MNLIYSQLFPISKGAKVIIGSRNKVEGEPDIKETIEAIKEETKNQDIHHLELDLNSIKSIDNFVSNFEKQFDSLDILVNNAGICNIFFFISQNFFLTHFFHLFLSKGRPKFGQSEEWAAELTISVNFLGPYRLTEKLIPLLSETHKKKKENSRIIYVSSESHRLINKLLLDQIDDVTQLNSKESFSSWNGMIPI